MRIGVRVGVRVRFRLRILGFDLGLGSLLAVVVTLHLVGLKP